MKRCSPDVEALVIAQMERLGVRREVAKEVGVSVKLVNRILADAGRPKKARRVYTAAQRTRVRLLAKMHPSWSITRIAHLVGVTPTSARLWILPLRPPQPRGERPRYLPSLKAHIALRAERGESLASLAREVGCQPSTVLYWVKRRAAR